MECFSRRTTWFKSGSHPTTYLFSHRPGGYEQERRLLDLSLGFLKTAYSRRSARENGLFSILETQAGGGSIIYRSLVPRLLLTFAPDGLEIHKEIALHHSFLPAGLTHALPQAVSDLEQLSRRRDGEGPPVEGSSDSSDEETGPLPRGSTFKLDLMRVALDGAFSWVQLMLMLTYHDELVEALAMKLLRERNAELSQWDQSPSEPSPRSNRETPSGRPGPPDFFASPREPSDSGRASSMSGASSDHEEPAEPAEASSGSDSEASGSASSGSGGKSRPTTDRTPPVKEDKLTKGWLPIILGSFCSKIISKSHYQKSLAVHEAGDHQLVIYQLFMFVKNLIGRSPAGERCGPSVGAMVAVPGQSRWFPDLLLQRGESWPGGPGAPLRPLGEDMDGWLEGAIWSHRDPYGPLKGL